MSGPSGSSPRFQLGRVYITPGALESFEMSGQSPHEYLRRHHAGDWGELSERDRRENELSLERGFRLLSSYRTGAGVKFWIITEADRSATTILLPDEY